jgi:hypothetical protein
MRAAIMPWFNVFHGSGVNPGSWLFLQSQKNKKISSEPLSIQRPCKRLAIYMERQSVKSVILRSVGYDAGAKSLEIEFRTGLVYRYSGVPLNVFEDLMHSAEKGKYFSEKIRPRFPAKQAGA